MSIFPLINPNVKAQENPTPHGNELDSTIAGIADKVNPYASDLMQEIGELKAFNDAIAQKTMEVAQLEEAEKGLKTLTELEQKALTSKTNVHELMSKHHQFLAGNANKVAQINMAHQLGMLGHDRTQKEQTARFTGLASARAAIAARMRGGPAA